MKNNQRVEKTNLFSPEPHALSGGYREENGWDKANRFLKIKDSSIEIN
jgi:hypothetical protein